MGVPAGGCERERRALGGGDGGGAAGAVEAGGPPLLVEEHGHDERPVEDTACLFQVRRAGRPLASAAPLARLAASAWGPAGREVVAARPPDRLHQRERGGDEEARRHPPRDADGALPAQGGADERLRRCRGRRSRRVEAEVGEERAVVQHLARRAVRRLPCLLVALARVRPQAHAGGDGGSVPPLARPLPSPPAVRPLLGVRAADHADHRRAARRQDARDEPQPAPRLLRPRPERRGRRARAALHPRGARPGALQGAAAAAEVRAGLHQSGGGRTPSGGDGHLAAASAPRHERQADFGADGAAGDDAQPDPRHDSAEQQDRERGVQHQAARALPIGGHGRQRSALVRRDRLHHHAAAGEVPLLNRHGRGHRAARRVHRSRRLRRGHLPRVRRLTRVNAECGGRDGAQILLLQR
mmetsp:Transcript_6089/g.12585  ORF Transcript_6089/g.12585 Transcript_6089/m.12585 type:complete len:413 (-) Transcript_6089:935-2173(-)